MKTVITKKALGIIIPVTALIFLLAMSCGKSAKEENNLTNGAYVQVDIMPVFPGGDSALLGYVARNTIYPSEAKEKGIQGKVLAKFMVTAEGGISDVEILQSVNPLLDAESLRVIKSLPKFTPGILNGKAVAVWYMLPISFKLQ
jgi:periplasmic protein TonB